MKKTVAMLAVLTATLAGCANPGVVKMSPDTYMISRTDKGGIFGNASAMKADVIREATCQLCGLKLMLANGSSYSEAHHVQPLGRPHNGPDVASNIVVLCPNHHVMLDYGAMTLEARKLNTIAGHSVGARYIEYHNANIAKSDAV